VVPDCIQVDNSSEFTGKALDRGPTTNMSRWTSRGRANRQITRALNRLTAASLGECLNIHWFLSLTDTQAKIEQWHKEYNGFRPHSSLNNLTPDKVVAAATTVELQNA